MLKNICLVAKIGQTQQKPCELLPMLMANLAKAGKLRRAESTQRHAPFPPPQTARPEPPRAPASPQRKGPSTSVFFCIYETSISSTTTTLGIFFNNAAKNVQKITKKWCAYRSAFFFKHRSQLLLRVFCIQNSWTWQVISMWLWWLQLKSMKSFCIASSAIESATGLTNAYNWVCRQAMKPSPPGSLSSWCSLWEAVSSSSSSSSASRCHPYPKSSPLSFAFSSSLALIL